MKYTWKGQLEAKSRVSLDFSAKDQSYASTGERQRNDVARDMGFVLKGAVKGHGETRQVALGVRAEGIR